MLGLNQYEGTFRLVKDKAILEKLDMSKYPKPGLRVIDSKEEVWDDLHVKVLDHYEFTQNIFFELHSGEAEDEVNILVLNLAINFYFGLKKGIGSINGWTQDMAYMEDGPIWIKLQDC